MSVAPIRRRIPSQSNVLHFGQSFFFFATTFVWIPLSEELPKPKARNIVLAWGEGRQRDPAHQWLRGLIRDWARESGAKLSEKEAMMRALLEKNFA